MGVKSPLAVGVAAGGLMLAQAMITPDADAGKQCTTDSQCKEHLGESCKRTVYYFYDWVWDAALQMHVIPFLRDYISLAAFMK